MALHNEILTDTPASTDDWFERIAILRKAVPRPDLPATETELRRELSALARLGLIEDRGGIWHPTYRPEKPAKPSPQKGLF